MRKVRGFTLIELTLVATIMAIIAGLVIIRWGIFSARQQAISSARQLGNTLSQYRERAQSEQTLYAVVLNLDANSYSIFRAIEKNPATLQNSAALKSFTLVEPVRFGKVFQDDTTLASPVCIFLDAKGILPNIRIEIQSGETHVVMSPDVFVNENHYNESQ